ncbi:MAG: nitrile hydratase subunit beta, partial [Actinomycetota bacterium]|nr:nitrile hydratase subunit beta [Actinomycetota bacterium]
MDGVHDLGGIEGFGPVVVDPEEPVFSAPWEQRVFGLNFAALPANVDRFRHAIERMGAVAYLTTSYYEHWLAALERLVVETGA